VTASEPENSVEEPAGDLPEERSLSPDLTIVQERVFRGPNYYSYEPSIKLLVDLGSLEYYPSNTIEGFNEGLLDMLSGVGEHSCSRGHAGGFRERLIEGTWAGHIAEHIAIELQRVSGARVSPVATTSSTATGKSRLDWRQVGSLSAW
jgi:cyanophycin synthetase